MASGPRKFIAIVIILALVAIVIAVSVSSGTKGMAIAASAVETFHQQLNDSKFQEIYNTGTPAFKSAANEPDFMKFIQAVHRKLGAFQSSTRAGWGCNVGTGGTVVNLSYESQYETGKATESFVFIVNGQDAALQSYRVDSPALIAD